MAKTNESIVVLEFFIFILIGAFVYALFSQGVSWMYVQFISILIFIGAFLPLGIEAKLRGISIINGKSVVLLGVLAWILLDPLTVKEGIEEFPPEDILKVFLMIIIFLIMLYLGYLIKWPRFFIRIFRKFDHGYNISPKKLLYLIVVIFFIGLLPIIIWGGGLKNVMWHLTHAGRFAAPWGRARLGNWTDYYKTTAEYFNILAIQLIWFYLIFIKKNIWLILIAIFGIWIIFDSGTRTILAAAIIPLFLIYYLNSFYKGKKQRYAVVIFLYFLLSIMQFQLVFRQSPAGHSIGEIMRDSFLGILKTKPVQYQRDDQFYRLLKVVEIVPSGLPHSNEPLILKPLYHFVPRAIWKDKPQGITWFFERTLQEKGVGFTTFAVSILGEFYICNGWLGICLAGILMGFLAKQFDSLIEMTKRSPAILLIYCYGLMFLFISVRSYQIICEGWYIFIFFYLTFMMTKKKKPLYVV